MTFGKFSRHSLAFGPSALNSTPYSEETLRSPDAEMQKTTRSARVAIERPTPSFCKYASPAAGVEAKISAAKMTGHPTRIIEFPFGIAKELFRRRARQRNCREVLVSHNEGIRNWKGRYIGNCQGPGDKTMFGQWWIDEVLSELYSPDLIRLLRNLSVRAAKLVA